MSSNDNAPIPGTDVPPTLTSGQSSFLKVTPYMLSNFALLLLFAVSKMALIYRGPSAVPTELDWINWSLGVPIAIG